MSVPLRTQAGAVKVYMRFVEFLAGRVITLQERLGPNTTTVPLESETGGQSMSPMHQRSSSPSPACKPSPPPKRGSPVSSRHGSPAASRHGSPPRTDSGKKASAPMGIGGEVFSPQSQSTFKLWADLHLSDQDVDDTFTNEEGKDRHQTPLPVPGKHSHLSSDDEKSPSKKAKLDVSNLYGVTPNTSAKGVSVTGKGDGAAGKGDGAAGKGDEDPESKTHKHKKTKKSKKKQSKRNKKDTDKKDSKEDKKKPTGGDQVTPEKKKMPEKKVPEKTDRNPSGDENLETPTKSKKKPIWTVQECRRDKWASDLPLVIGYCQCRAISIHNLPEGRNFDDHTDYIRQLIRHESLGVNIKSLDDRIQKLEGLTSAHHVGLLAALKEWKGKQMGNSGITPQYIVKAFAEPVSQRKIVKCHDDHWHSDLMIGLYSIHQYDTICKENARRADGAKSTALGFCPTCSYTTGNHASINNHVRAHYRLLLECSYNRCVFMEADCTKMYEHVSRSTSI